MKFHLHNRKLPNLSGKEKNSHYLLRKSGNLGKKYDKIHTIKYVPNFEKSGS